jgi:hypothetical protein
MSSNQSFEVFLQPSGKKSPTIIKFEGRGQVEEFNQLLGDIDPYDSIILKLIDDNGKELKCVEVPVQSFVSSNISSTYLISEGISSQI